MFRVARTAAIISGMGHAANQVRQSIPHSRRGGDGAPSLRVLLRLRSCGPGH